MRDDLARGFGAHQRERRAELGEAHRVEIIKRPTDRAEEHRAARQQTARPLDRVAEGLPRLGDGVEPLLQAPRRAEVPDRRRDNQQIAAQQGIEQQVEPGEVGSFVVGERAVVGGVQGRGAAGGEVDGVALREEVQIAEREGRVGGPQAVDEGVGEASRARLGGVGARDDAVDEQGGAFRIVGCRRTIRSPR